MFESLNNNKVKLLMELISNIINNINKMKKIELF